MRGDPFTEVGTESRELLHSFERMIPTTMETLDSAMARLSLNAKKADPAAIEARLVEEENGTFNDTRPRKQTRKSADDLLAELENEFLTPSSSFSPRWLNMLQKYFVSRKALCEDET